MEYVKCHIPCVICVWRMELGWPLTVEEEEEDGIALGLCCRGWKWVSVVGSGLVWRMGLG